MTSVVRGVVRVPRLLPARGMVSVSFLVAMMRPSGE